LANYEKNAVFRVSRFRLTPELHYNQDVRISGREDRRRRPGDERLWKIGRDIDSGEAQSGPGLLDSGVFPHQTGVYGERGQTGKLERNKHSRADEDKR
jgi:hypothetical protein